jgi:hypothetical protein
MPGDPQDDGRDCEADDRVSDRNANRNHPRGYDDAQAHVGVRARVLPVCDQCGTVEALPSTVRIRAAK